MSAQFDRALAEAAETMESFGLGWDDIGLNDPEEEAEPDFLPLEFQLADLERAVDSMLHERDRFLHGGDADRVAAGRDQPQPAVLGKGSG